MDDMVVWRSTELLNLSWREPLFSMHPVLIRLRFWSVVYGARLPSRWRGMYSWMGLADRSLSAM